MAQDTTSGSPKSEYVPNILNGLLQDGKWGTSSNPLSGKYTAINGNSTQTELMMNPLSSSTTGNSTKSIELSIDKSGGKLDEHGYPTSPDSIRIEDPSYYVLAYIIKIF